MAKDKMYMKKEEKEYKPHMMYCGKKRKGYMAKTFAQHLALKKKGVITRKLNNGSKKN